MAEQYRRSLPVNSHRDYWLVDLGRLDYANGPANYPFPSEESAIRFAKVHKRISPDRYVAVRYPSGHIQEIHTGPTTTGEAA